MNADSIVNVMHSLFDCLFVFSFLSYDLRSLIIFFTLLYDVVGLSLIFLWSIRSVASKQAEECSQYIMNTMFLPTSLSRSNFPFLIPPLYFFISNFCFEKVFETSVNH